MGENDGKVRVERFTDARGVETCGQILHISDFGGTDIRYRMREHGTGRVCMLTAASLSGVFEWVDADGSEWEAEWLSLMAQGRG